MGKNYTIPQLKLIQSRLKKDFQYYFNLNMFYITDEIHRELNKIERKIKELEEC